MTVDLDEEIGRMKGLEFDTPLDEFEYIVLLLTKAMATVVDRSMDLISRADLNLGVEVSGLLATAIFRDYLTQQLIGKLMKQQETTLYTPILKQLVLNRAGVTEP